MSWMHNLLETTQVVVCFGMNYPTRKILVQQYCSTDGTGRYTQWIW